jgi:cyclopropane fatty-acyl-phospholipid synthase-like methyltransferase
MLQSIGAGSAIIAGLIAGAGIDVSRGRVLDVGSGVGALSIAFARTFSGSSVIGLEPWEPSRTLAMANVAAAGLEDRVTFVPQVIETFDDSDGFELVWLPGPFLSGAILETAVARAVAVTNTNGHVVLGTFGAVGDPLADAVSNLRTVRFGGTVLTPVDAALRLTDAGLVDVTEIERAAHAAVGLVVGRRA